MISLENITQKLGRKKADEQFQTPIPVDDKPKKRFGESLMDFARSVFQPITSVYQQHYQEDPENINKILGRQVGRLEAAVSAPGKFMPGTGLGIAQTVFNFLKPNDFKKQMDRTEELYNRTAMTYDEGSRMLRFLENEKKNNRIAPDIFKNETTKIANRMFVDYNENAERLGLGKMTSFSEYESAMITLANINKEKGILRDMKDEAKADFLPRIFQDKTDPEIRAAISEQHAQQQAELQQIIADAFYRTDDIAKGRMFNGKEVTNAQMQKMILETSQRLMAEYNSLLEVKETALQLMKDNPGFNPVWSVERIDNAISKAQDGHKTLLKDYINNIGKTGAQSINEYTRSFEQRNQGRIADLFGADVGLGFRVSDVRELRNIKNLMLLQRDRHQLKELSGGEDILNSLSKITTGLLSPVTLQDGKLKLGSSTALTALSLARGTVVTPTFKNAASFINTTVNKALLGNTTDFYNANINMLKSAMFNFDESKDYTVTNFFRKSAELAPDIAEFIIPISKVAVAQQALWKGTIAFNRSTKYAKQLQTLAKGFTKGGNAGMRTGAFAEDLSKLPNSSAFNSFQKGLTHMLLDYNVINAPFESRNPKEYSGMDAIFDLSFVGTEVLFALKKTSGPLSGIEKRNQLKNSTQFQEEVFKYISYKHIKDPELVNKYWGEIVKDPKQHIAAVTMARKMIQLGDSFDAISFVAGIDPAKFAGAQDVMVKRRDDALTELSAKYREGIFEKGALSEDEIMKIANDTFEKLNIGDTVKARDEYLVQQGTQAPLFKRMPVRPSKVDETLSDVFTKIDSGVEHKQQQALSTLRTKIDEITQKLSEAKKPTEVAKLQDERAFYLNFLEYYGKTAKEVKANMATKVNRAVDTQGNSAILGQYGFKTKVGQKYSDLLTNKQGGQREWVTSEDDWVAKYFKGFDGEVYPVDINRMRYIGLGDTHGTEFMIIRTPHPKKKGQYYFHPEDYIKTGGQDKIPAIDLETRIVAGPDVKLSPVEESIKKEMAAFKPANPYEEFVSTAVGSNTEKYITKLAQAEPIPAAYVIDALPNGMINKFDKAGYRLLTEFSNIPISNNTHINRLFGTQLTDIVFRNINKSMDAKGVKEAVDNTNKYLKEAEKISLSKEEVDYIISKRELSNDSIDVEKLLDVAGNAATDTNAQLIIHRFDSIGQKPKPLVMDGDIVTADIELQRKINKQMSLAEATNNPVMLKEAEENMKAFNVTKADMSIIDGGSLINNSDLIVTKNTSKWLKWLFPQVADNMPIKFKNTMQEFKMNNATYYKMTKDGKTYQLSEYIDKPGTVKFNEMRDNLDKFYKKEPLDPAIEAEVRALADTIERYKADMDLLTLQAFPDYKAPPMTDVEKTLSMIRESNANESLFFYLSKNDKNLYKSIVDAPNKGDIIKKYGIPNPAGLSEDVVFSKFKNSFIDLARQGKGNQVIRAIGSITGMGDGARRTWNFLTGGAYIFGTTVVNMALVPSMLFINAIGLSTDAIFSLTRRFKSKGINQTFWKNADLGDLMTNYGILASVDDVARVPGITNPLGLMRHYSDIRNRKGLQRLTSNMVNGGLYNAAEMTFDQTFKRARILETLVSDRGIRNMDEFNAYLKGLDNTQKDMFLKQVNDASIRRYVYKTGNDFDGLKKFTYGHDVNFFGKFAKQFMRSISLLTNRGTTHIRSFNDLISNYRLNKVALNNYELGKGSLRDSKKVTQDLLNYNHDYEMFINKLFFTLNLGQKFDRIADNDIEDDISMFDKANDVRDFAKYLYAPFAGFESNAVVRILSQTIGSAILANKYDEHDINAVKAAGTTFLSRVLSEMKKRFIVPSSIIQGVTLTQADPDNTSHVAHEVWKAYKKSTAGFGYFLDRDLNYYGYEVDMPYTPGSELKLFMPEYDKMKMKFMDLNTVRQLEELQKTDKTFMDYIRWRIPMRRDIEIGKMGVTTNLDKINHYMINTPKIWNELLRGDLKLNQDLEAGEYVYNTLTEHASQDFGDGKATKNFLDTFAKEHLFKTDDGKLLPLGDMNSKEAIRVKNMFKLADEDKMGLFFSEFLQADNNKQKQGFHLLAFVQAQLDAQGKNELVPGAMRLLTAAIAKDMYYQLSNQEKKRLGYSWGDGYLSDLNPKVDQEIKYIVADTLGESLYHTDKDARVGVMRYFARDTAIKEGRDDIVNLFTHKYSDKDPNQIKFGRVNLAYNLEKEERGKGNNYLYTNMNNIYLWTQIQAAEGKLNGDRFNTAFSVMLAPRNQKRVNDPVYYNMSLTMAKTIAQTIDESNAPEQDKVSAKAAIFYALNRILDKADDSVIEAIGEDSYWKGLDRLRGTHKTIGEIEMEMAYKTAQNGKVPDTYEDTGTIMDYYDANGNYKNTFWNKDPIGSYGKNKKYYDSVRNFVRNNYNIIPKIQSLNTNTYGKEAHYKNLYLKFTDAASQGIPGGIGKGSGTTTGFTLKGGRPISLQRPQPRKSDAGLVARARDAGLIRQTGRSSGGYPAITAQRTERKG